MIFIDKYEVSQKNWTIFRDSQLDMKFPEKNKRASYGSMYPMCETGYLTQLTKLRTKQLKEWLEPLPGNEGCGGSIN